MTAAIRTTALMPTRNATRDTNAMRLRQIAGGPAPLRPVSLPLPSLWSRVWDSFGVSK